MSHRCGCGGMLQEEKVVSESRYQGKVMRFDMFRYRCSVCRHVFLHYDPLKKINSPSRYQAAGCVSS